MLSTGVCSQVKCAQGGEFRSRLCEQGADASWKLFVLFLDHPCHGWMQCGIQAACEFHMERAADTGQPAALPTRFMRIAAAIVKSYSWVEGSCLDAGSLMGHLAF